MNEGMTLQQCRAKNLQEQRGIKHTYDRDFECLEVNEQDLNLLSDNDVNSANDSLDADATCTVEEEKNKKNSKSVASPQNSNAKAPASRQKQSTSSVGSINRKFWIIIEQLSLFVYRRLTVRPATAHSQHFLIHTNLTNYKLFSHQLTLF